MRSEEAGSNIALDTNLGLLFHFTKTTCSPYLTVGGAFYRNVAGDLGQDVHYAAFWGLGVVGQLTHYLGLRIQARQVTRVWRVASADQGDHRRSAQQEPSRGVQDPETENQITPPGGRRPVGALSFFPGRLMMAG